MTLRKIPLFFFVVLCLDALTRTCAQELRRPGERSMVFCWLFDCPGRNNNNNNNNNSTSSSTTESNNDRGWISETVNNIWCGVFRTCEDKSNSSSPVGEIVQDAANASDGSTPIRDAFNASRGSDTPLRDFFGKLLGQEESTTPVRDFMEEAYNRTDAPLLDFIAELYETVQNVSAQGFVSQIVNGTAPVGTFVSEWLTEDVFGNLNCSEPAGPTCAYNLEGDEGVWVCRSIKNPFKLDSDPVNRTLCSPPNFSFVNNDQCGSCDGTYPTPCTCLCDFQGTGDGVLVTLDGGTSRECVNADWATGALVSFDSLRCVTAC